MKMYNKEGTCCNVDKDQVPVMLKGGWDRKAPTKVEASADTKETEKATVETKVAKPKVVNRISKSAVKKITKK